MRLLAAIFVAATLALAAPTTQAASPSEADLVVKRAQLALEDFLVDKHADEIRVYVQNAFAVLIIPDMLKAGFVLGAEYGNGVLLVRDTTTGQFGPPAFYRLFGGSIGLQAGGKTSGVMFTIMNEAAVKTLLAGSLKLGAEAEIALATVGAGIGTATTPNFGEDIYVFERSQGLFAGFSFDGSGVISRKSYDEAYYGRPVAPATVVRDFASHDPKSLELRETLLRF